MSECPVSGSLSGRCQGVSESEWPVSRCQGVCVSGVKVPGSLCVRCKGARESECLRVWCQCVRESAYPVSRCQGV